MTQLNSSVIRVFKRDYASDSTPEINVIVSDCIDFYAHTVLRVGIERGAWCKVGTSTDIGNPDNIMFRWFDEMDFSGITKSFNWYVWKINKPETFIGEMEESYKKYDLGMVYSYKNIVARIRTGKYLQGGESRRRRLPVPRARRHESIKKEGESDVTGKTRRRRDGSEFPIRHDRRTLHIYN
jgi:hypothetical protein